MPFIHPTWDNEGQRLGKRKCAAAVYALHVIAEWPGLAGLPILLAVLGFPAWEWSAAAAFRVSLLWLLAPPLGLGGVGEGCLYALCRLP